MQHRATVKVYSLGESYIGTYNKQQHCLAMESSIILYICGELHLWIGRYPPTVPWRKASSSWMAFSYQMILNLKHKALNTSVLQLNLMCNLNIALKQTGALEYANKQEPLLH